MTTLLALELKLTKYCVRLTSQALVEMSELFVLSLLKPWRLLRRCSIMREANSCIILVWMLEEVELEDPDDNNPTRLAVI